MIKIEIQTLKDIKRIMQNICPNRIVFWIGAGIDSSSPTDLPLGYTLTDFILELSLGVNTSNLIREWENNYKIIKSTVNDELELSLRPRLETVIEAIREFENHQIEKQSIINGLSSFSAKEFHYNKEHYLLAHYLNRGANIVTTNYGDFICKAYEDEYGVNQIIHEYKDMHLYRANNEWKSCIYHIHGISSDLETIGANLTTVKNSLPCSFVEKFSYWIENEYIFIFMGYSGLDSLDVNPFLKGFYNEKNTIGIYVRHTVENDIMPISEKEKVLLQPFDKKIVCPCLTRDFFSTLFDFEKIKNINFNVDRTDWKEVFKKYITGYSKEYSDAFISGLCHRLGLSILKVMGTKKWLNVVTRAYKIDPWYKDYYSFENAIITNQKRIIKKQGKKLLNNNDDTLIKMDYEMAKGNLSKVLSIPNDKMFKYIKQELNTSRVIDWSISTKLNRYIEWMLFETLKSLMLFPRKVYIKKQIYNIKIAKECLELIIKGNYDFVIHIHQITTAYRSLAICQALLGLEFENSIDNINIALHMYADVSSINGISMTLLYKLIILLLNYKYSKNTELLNEARNVLRITRKVIYKCGLKKYYKRFIIVYIFYIFIKINKY